MPSQLCHLENLRVLDLSLNELSGNIPECLDEIEGMKEDVFQSLLFSSESIFLMWKGAVSEFKNLELLQNIDFSSNKLIGEIPKEITKLVGLVSLNLSRNNLSGQIPLEIGQLKSLDALDLSNNHLSGRIPSSLAQVDRLGILDLSVNNLSGKIPTGPQLQTRDATAYLGNPELCGDPLPKKCHTEEEPTSPEATEDVHDDQEDQDGYINPGFYVAVGLGFIVGFWGVCGALIFKKSWRYGYFRLLNDIGDWIYVVVAVRKAKLLGMIGS